MKILAIFDNKGKTIDRYTIVLSTKNNYMYDMLGCDNIGGKAFSQFSNGQFHPTDDRHNKHLGKRIQFEKLNYKTQKHIAERIFL